MNIKYVIIAIVALLAALLFFYKYRMAGLNLIISQLVIKAELAYQSKQGQAKKRWVIQEVYKIIPVWLKWIISEDTISDMIEFVLLTLQGVFKKIGG